METLKHKFNYASDEEIIEKIRAGETLLFEVLIRRYNQLLYKVARAYGFTHQDAEDLLQETHFAAFRYLDTFRHDASYKTWLTKIHLNHCYQKLHDGRLKFEEGKDDFLNDEGTAISARAEKQNTEHSIITRELGRLLEKSLQQIPLPYRTVFVLREIEGFHVNETAELLGITPINVKVRLNRAKTMLQKQLEKFYSATDLFEFHLTYCDKIVSYVFERINAAHRSES